MKPETPQHTVDEANPAALVGRGARCPRTTPEASRALRRRTPLGLVPLPLRPMPSAAARFFTRTDGRETAASPNPRLPRLSVRVLVVGVQLYSIQLAQTKCTGD